MIYDLPTILDKLKSLIGLDKESLLVYIQDTNGNYLEQNIKTDVYLHPMFGFCLTLDAKALNDFIWIDFYLLDDFFETTLMFLHEKEELPSVSGAHLDLKKDDYARVEVEKQVEIQPSLNRLPCSKNHFQTCQDNHFHQG